jgi:uncharacterized cupin superfamily protein
MSDTLFRFPHEALGQPVAERPAPDRLVEGDPLQRSWNFDTTADDTVIAGVWESEAGAWTSIKGESWELCHILSGVSVIEEEGKPPLRLVAGDTFVMRPGFVGIWRVLETTRKVYVIKRR